LKPEYHHIKSAYTASSHHHHHLKMSTSVASLFIGYARSTCTTEQVKRVFDTAFQADIVSQVDEVIKKDPNGYEFKIFFVHFKQEDNDQLVHFMVRLKMAPDGFIPVVYSTEYDKKLGERVERYWKVLPFTPKPVKITGIRIMTEEETALITRPKHLDAPVVDVVLSDVD
jgi:hypothetical protein